MPIATISAKLVYFAHVPRCGGTSVENYLRGRFGPLALLDRQFIADPLLRTWCRSSPQHMEVAVLDRLIPPAFFAATFALVRHPADRLASVFRFQRDIERTIDPATGFTTWLDGLPKRLAEDPFHLDNHLRPMTDLVPANAVIFRLENGMEPVLTWIDELAGDTRGARKMPTANSHADRLAAQETEPLPAPELTDDALDIIARLYAADFERFGYDPEKPEPSPAAANPTA